MTPIQLRAAAAVLGLSDLGLARVLGVNEHTYLRWLEGASMPQIAVVAIRGMLAARQS
jgi:hypothetical protein